MNRLDIPRFLFYTLSVAGVLGISFAFGLYSGAKQNVVYVAISTFKEGIEESFTQVIGESSTVTKIHPKHFLQRARYNGDGVTVNNIYDGEDVLILLSGFFRDTNELRLIRRNGEIVSRWPVRFSEIFPDANHLLKPPETDWNIDTHGALSLPDGSVVFNFELGGLVKLDRFGNVVWKLARETHHSVELSENGGFWVPGRRVYPEGSKSYLPPFMTPFREDTIMRVSEDGVVIKEISVPKLFYDNGLEALLTSTGHTFRKDLKWDEEIVHLNKIEELPSTIAEDFPMFEAGDLLLSIRNYNMICVLDPDTCKIKWWRIGPWLRQHDPEFKRGGTIIVFNNNNYYGSIFLDVKSGDVRKSNIMEIDPVTDVVRIIYGGESSQEMLSIIRGKHELTPNDGLLITEFEGGRVFETDGTGRVLWEYLNRYDTDEVAEITEARVYPISYFNVSDWRKKGGR